MAVAVEVGGGGAAAAAAAPTAATTTATKLEEAAPQREEAIKLIAFARALAKDLSPFAASLVILRSSHLARLYTLITVPSLAP